MTTKIKSGVIGDNVVGITQLNVSDGTNGQVLTTDGSGTLSFSTISGYTDSDVETYLNTSEIYTDATNDRLGIGDSLPATKLEVVDANGIGLRFGDIAATPSSQTAGYIGMSTSAYSGVNGDLVLIPRTSTSSRILLMEGNVGIGITSPSGEFHVDSGLAPCDIHFTTGSSGGTGYDVNLNMTGGANNSEMNLNMGIAGNADREQIKTYQSTMTFTTADAERMRITSGGAFKTKQGTSSYFNATSNYNEICSDTGATTNLLIRHGATYYADIVNLWYYGGTPNDTQSHFLNAFDSTATRAKIFSNGGFANYQSNDSNLCDEREKKNIVASNSTWNDVKSWNIKKFHYNEDDDSDAKRYGVIAQDIEITNPDLIVDWEKQQSRAEELWQEEDRPLPEGVSVGDVKTPAQAQVMRKAVKEQQMYMMAIKALQEALTKIEQLETRIETLEG